MKSSRNFIAYLMVFVLFLGFCSDLNVYADVNDDNGIIYNEYTDSTIVAPEESTTDVVTIETESIANSETTTEIESEISTSTVIEETESESKTEIFDNSITLQVKDNQGKYLDGATMLLKCGDDIVVQWVSGKNNDMHIKVFVDGVSATLNDDGNLVVNGLSLNTEYTYTTLTPKSGYTADGSYMFILRGVGVEESTHSDVVETIIPEVTTEEPTTLVVVKKKAEWRNVGSVPKAKKAMKANTSTSNSEFIMIKAGQNDELAAEIFGKIRYYYEPSANLADAVITYDSNYITFEGDGDFYNENSKVYVATDVFSGEDNNIDGGMVNPCFNDADELEFRSVEQDLNNGSYTGHLNVLAKNMFVAKRVDSYYVVKIVTPSVDGDNVSYVKFHTEIETGDVELKAFQMNVDTSEGAVSEFSPSSRTVSRASKVVVMDEDPITTIDENGNEVINYKVSAIQAFGTIYTTKDDVTKDDMQFSIDYQYDLSKENGNFEIANGIRVQEATKDKGVLKNWANATDKNSFYYAMTLRPINYNLNILDTDYTWRAYAVTENGTIIYGKNIATTSIYKIADVLYNNNLMNTEASHNFLYDNVLNIVTINNNRTYMVNAMTKALNIRATSDPLYQYCNTYYKDLYYYIHFTKFYHVGKYYERGEFISKTLTNGENTEEVLLSQLNNITTDGRQYNSVAEWIDNEIDLYYPGKGFYKKVPYKLGR